MLDLYQAAFTALAGRIAATEAQREVFWEQLHDTLQDKIQLKKKKKGGGNLFLFQKETLRTGSCDRRKCPLSIQAAICLKC